jgi:L-fuconolactonase
MKIDCHQHFWKYNPVEYDWIDDQMATIRRDFLPADLSLELDKLHFDGSVAVQARQLLDETEWLLQLADHNPKIKGVVGWVDLRSDAVVSQLEKYALHPKFVGVRHVVQGEPADDFILGTEFNKGVELLKKYNLTYDILVFPRQLPNAVKFARNHPGITMVLDHIAKPYIKDRKISPWDKDIFELASLPNVYCKVSGMVTEADFKNWNPQDFKPYLDVIFEAFGTDRVMIGSDWPVCLVGGSYSAILGIVMDYISKFSEEQKDNILGNNAVKAYNLVR